MSSISSLGLYFHLSKCWDQLVHLDFASFIGFQKFRSSLFVSNSSLFGLNLFSKYSKSLSKEDKMPTDSFILISSSAIFLVAPVGQVS